MLKHRGFPGRMPGTDFQFTIRRANVKEGATKLIKRERFRDRKTVDRKADEAFMAALWQYFGEEPFERGNLDAGRLSWLFGRGWWRRKTRLTPARTRRCCGLTPSAPKLLSPRSSPRMRLTHWPLIGTRTRIRHEFADP
jgi:hypothetical protein